MGKRGPQSYVDQAKKPSRMGMRARIIFKNVVRLSKDARKSYRGGMSLIRKWCPNELDRWGVPELFDLNNQFKGKIPGSPAEFRTSSLTEYRLARCLELADERGCTNNNLRTMRKLCSFLYQLQSGKQSENFGLVNSMMDCLLKGAPKPQPPVLYGPRPDQLRTAFTSEWRGPGTGLSLLQFEQGVLGGWDWPVLGSRPWADLNKIKRSVSHLIDLERKIFVTDFVDGRSKLALEKRGTRPWKAWRICLCPNNEHHSPPEDFGPWSLDEDGNPKQPLGDQICTTCPVFAGEFLQKLQYGQEGDFRIYKKPTNDSRFNRNGNNHHSVISLAHRFFAYQGITPHNKPFHPESGRKACGLWNGELRIPYFMNLHLTGDTEKTWRVHYQQNLADSNGYEVREQSTDPNVATAALKELRKFFGRDPPPEPVPEGLTGAQQLLLRIAENVGIRDGARYFA